MTVILASLALLQTGSAKPAGWIDQKFGNGITLSAPRVLKKMRPDPKENVTGDVWDDNSGGIDYGLHIDTPKSKSAGSADEAIATFCQEMTESFPGTVDGERDLLLQGWRGIAITIKAKDYQTVAVRGFYYRDRMVAAFVMFDPRGKRPESVDQFLNSVRFGTNGTATLAGPDYSRYPLGKTGISGLFPFQPALEPNPNKQIAFSYSSDYCDVDWSVQGINLPPDQRVFQGQSRVDFCGGFLESYLKDEQAKPIDRKEISIGIEHGVRSNYNSQERGAGSAAIIQHGKVLLIIEISGPKPYLSSQTIDAFFQSIQFADEPPGTAPQQASTSWVDQVLGEGLKISSPRKLTKEAPDKDPDLTKTLQTWSDDSDAINFQVQIMRSKETANQPIGLILTGFVKGAVGEVKGSIDGEKDLLLQGWPGLALTIVTPDGATVVTRAYLYNGAMISVAVGYPTADGRPSSVDKFLDSLSFPTNGNTAAAGPPMTRYPLGASGISAMFPMEPIGRDIPINVKGRMKGVLVHTYSGVYANRAYTVGYMDFPSTIPEPTPRDLTDFYNEEMDKLGDEIKAKTTKQKDLAFGENMGLYREFSRKDGVGSSAIVYHKRRGIFLVEYGPKAYGDPASLDAFFKSLEFSN